MGSIGGRGGIKIASASAAQARSQQGTVVHTRLKPMIKAHSSERMVFSGISDVVIASVHSDKTRLKKLMKDYQRVR